MKLIEEDGLLKMGFSKSSNFSGIQKTIGEQLANIIEFEELKNLSPRQLYNEPYNTLLTQDQKIFLMDQGLINCHPATKEEKKIPNQGLSFDYTTYISQAFYDITQDMPLISDGFSRCHAVIIYNPETCSTMMLHVVDRTFEQYHIQGIQKFLSGAKGEAIFVYGSESRSGPEFDHESLQKLGCVSRNVFVSTGPFHRGLMYDPKVNKISVNRKDGTKTDLLQFNGFSSQTYDSEKRITYDIKNREQRLVFELFRQTINDHGDFYMLAGIFSETALDELLRIVEIPLGRSIDKEDFLHYCIENNKLIIDKDTFIFPCGFRYDNDNPPIYERYPDLKPEYAIDFARGSAANKFYGDFIVNMTKHGYSFIEGSNTSALLSDSVSNKVIIGHGLSKPLLYLVGNRTIEKKKQIITLIKNVMGDYCISLYNLNEGSAEFFPL